MKLDIKRIIKRTIEILLSEDKKENVSQNLKKKERIGHLEKKVMRLEGVIRELQVDMNRFWTKIEKLQAEMPKKH